MVLETGVKLITWIDEHWYKVVTEAATRYIPSVTTKLNIKDKPFLKRWYGDIGTREADMRLYEAQEKGKRIHWAWETVLKGGCVVYNPWSAPVYSQPEIEALQAKYGGLVAILHTQDEMAHVNRLNEQYKILKPEILAVETTVYDLDNMDAGTIDGVCKIEAGEYAISGAKPIKLPAGIYINDIKSGSNVTNDVWLQMAPYLVMYEKMFGEKLAGALVSHTGAKTKTGIPGLSTLYRDAKTLREVDYPDYRRASDLWMRDHKDDQPQTYEIPSLITIKGD